MYLSEVSCSCSGQDSYECDRVTSNSRHVTFCDRLASVHCMSTRLWINTHSIGEHWAIRCDHSRCFSEFFGAFMDLQIQFLTEIDVLCSWQPFYFVFMKQHTLDNLHVYSTDLLECIPEIPRQICGILESWKFDSTYRFNFRLVATRRWLMTDKQ